MTDPRTPAEMLEALGKPFPRSAIKQRQGGGGKALSYVETHTVINRLNSATNGDWTFHVRDVQWRNDLLMVLGELTIPGLGTRSGFGVQKVSDRGGEDLVKGASSDALKKCATLFGVALELYGPDYEADVSATPQRAPQRATRPQDTPQPRDPVRDRPNAIAADGTVTGRSGMRMPASAMSIDDHEALANERIAASPGGSAAMRRLHAIGAKHGIDHEGLRVLCNVVAAKRGLPPVASLKDAPDDLLFYTADATEHQPERAHQLLAEQASQQAELMPGTDAVPDPDRFTRI